MSETVVNLAAQIVMLGYDRPHLEDDFRRRLERHPVGGVFLSGDALGPADEVRALTAELQEAAARGAEGLGIEPLPLLIAVDQEGGPVQAWGPPHQPALPAAAEIGFEYQASGERLEVTLRAMEIGRRLSAVGINLDFAPVLDVATCAANPILGERSFGSRPELVAEVGCAFLDGLQAAGVLACGKHFPGHGDTDLDSHLTLPMVGHGAGRLETVELFPFAAAMSHGLEVVMTAHVLYPAWDAEHPATLSPAILGGVLRRDLGFSGVVISDCLEMRGVRERHDLVEAGLRAFAAGCDLLLLTSGDGGRQDELLAGLEAARRDGRLDEERWAASLRRLATLKGDWLVVP